MKIFSKILAEIKRLQKGNYNFKEVSYLRKQLSISIFDELWNRETRIFFFHLLNIFSSRKIEKVRTQKRKDTKKI